MDWTIGVLGFGSRRGLGIFLFTTASRTAMGPTQPPIQWVPKVLSLGVKRPGLEADHSPPSSAEVKESVELYLHSPSRPSWRGAQLSHRDNFTFTSTLPTSTPRSSKWSFSFRFFDQNFECVFYFPRRITCHAHHPLISFFDSFREYSTNYQVLLHYLSSYSCY
jgi:hypothetical protein